MRLLAMNPESFDGPKIQSQIPVRYKQHVIR
jgi:hypothetical protein